MLRQREVAEDEVEVRVRSVLVRDLLDHRIGRSARRTLIVAELDHLRAPPSEAETARRKSSKLSARQLELLERWGYPYVFDTWFFHMTLTRRLTAEEHAVVMPRAQSYFAETLRAPRMVRELCLFTQAAPGADFMLAERIALRG